MEEPVAPPQLAAAAVPPLPSPPPPPPRPAPSAAVLQALDAIWGEGRGFLGAVPFHGVGCMHLVVDLEAAAAAAPVSVAGEPHSDVRGRFSYAVAQAVVEQNQDWVAGLAAAPGRRQWQGVAGVHMLVHTGDAANRSFMAAVQTQAVMVQVGGADVRVPVRAELGHLPRGCCRVVLRGLPPHLALQGVTEALLRAVGYSAASGVTVLHERAGVASGPGGTGYRVPLLDRVVAVVRVPREFAGLPLLPRSVADEGWRMSVTVERALVSVGQVVLRQPPAQRPAAPALPEVVHPGVRPAMAAVYAAAGLAAGRPAGQQAPGQAALQPGARTGLGFVAGGDRGPTQVQQVGLRPGQARQRPAAAPAAPAADPAAQDELMLEAPPAPNVPVGDPGFRAACQWVADGVDECGGGDAEEVVAAAFLAEPAAYAEAQHASAPSELPRAFLVAIHEQARLLLGSERVEALAMPGAAALPGDADELMGLGEGAPAAGAGATAAGAGGPGVAAAAVPLAAPPSTPAQPTRTSGRLRGGAASGAAAGTSSWLGVQALALAHGAVRVIKRQRGSGAGGSGGGRGRGSQGGTGVGRVGAVSTSGGGKGRRRAAP